MRRLSDVRLERIVLQQSHGQRLPFSVAEGGPAVHDPEPDRQSFPREPAALGTADLYAVDARPGHAVRVAVVDGLAAACEELALEVLVRVPSVGDRRGEIFQLEELPVLLGMFAELPRDVVEGGVVLVPLPAPGRLRPDRRQPPAGDVDEPAPDPVGGAPSGRCSPSRTSPALPCRRIRGGGIRSHPPSC